MSEQAIRSAFLSRFGHEPTVVGLAPGRINLIGEHTDYNDGFVFPAAIDRGLWIAASEVDDLSNVSSGQMNDGEPFDVEKVVPGFTSSWSKYPAGMGWAMQGKVGHSLSNLQACIDSTIPIGSGVSSSAALEMAFGVVWNHINHLNLDLQTLAKLGQVCENQFVGVNSGIMDQMASALGKAGHAIFLDTRSLEIEYAPVPLNLSVVLCDTKKERALTTSAYNERRSQCEEASAIMGVSKLRDATMASLEAHKHQMSDVVYRRAKHVISENQRCLDFKAALASNEYDAIGALMKGSHESLQYDYEVSCPELDAMAAAAWDSPGCVGARMTGAGFGGACVALVQTDLIERFTETVLLKYAGSTGLKGEALSCSIVDGARILKA